MKKFYVINYTVTEELSGHRCQLSDKKLYRCWGEAQRRMDDLDMIGATYIHMDEISGLKHYGLQAIAAVIGFFGYRSEEIYYLFWDLMNESGYDMDSKLAAWFDEKVYQYRKANNLPVGL